MAARNVYISWTMARRTCYAALFRRCVSWVIQIHLILISLGKKNITYRFCSCRVISRFTCDTWLWKRKEKIRIVNCVEEVLCVCSSLSHPARRNEMTVGSASFWIRVCQVFCVCVCVGGGKGSRHRFCFLFLVCAVWNMGRPSSSLMHSAVKRRSWQAKGVVVVSHWMSSDKRGGKRMTGCFSTLTSFLLRDWDTEASH